MLRKISPLIILAFLPVRFYSQDWVKKLQDPNVNFYDVKHSFNQYWEREEKKEKFKSFFTFRAKTEKENEGYVMYKRWENYVEPRVYPSGDRSLLNKTNELRTAMIADHSVKTPMLIGGNWVPLGSFGVSANGGAGRVNCVAFHPSDPNIMFLGAPNGGLWKTTDGGTTWSTNTDNLPTLGVSAIAIDPSNPNVMYIGTGDVDASDSYGVGVLKSVDGGATWNITGLNWLVPQAKNVNRLLINPNNANMIFAGTSNGVFRSTDAGMTWTRMLTAGPIKDMEFKPGDPTIVYAASANGFYRSANTGLTFTAISVGGGLPSGATVNRVAIAVSPANPNYVYALFSNASDSGYKGLYLSTNSGVNFTLKSTYPNLLGYDYTGSDSGGNGWYTLSIAVAPWDADEVTVGGVNVWKSYDQGANWNCVAHWWGDGGLPYVHADIHNIVYDPSGSNMYVVCDGGIYRSPDSGISYTDISNSLQIGEMYRLGNSVTNPNMVIQGWQDNGCNLYNAGSFSEVSGGDGMECFIDWSTTNYMYTEYQNGAILRSSDGGGTFVDIINNITEPGVWVTPWCQDPVTPSTLYAGFQNVWKSTNRGNSWTPISSFTSSGLEILEVSKSNPLCIYAGTNASIWKTTNGGVSWTTVTFPLAGGDALTSLEISETDPNMIWITRSGYTAANKVYKSIDGGANWTNLSGSLPNIPVNCIVSQTGTNDGIYIGTDLGVYYLDNDLTSWMPFSNGLPNVTVDELEIHYGTNKLRAATFGRGLWETSIHDPSSPKPYANFTGDTLSGCPGFNVQYSDSTTNAPTSWLWRFPGGTPATSTLQNPVVTYNTPGLYHNVTLVVTNSFGTDSITKYSYIAVSPALQPVVSLNKNDTICAGQSVVLAATYGATYLWAPTGQTSSQITVNTTGTFSVTVTDSYGCALTSDSTHIEVLPAIPVPTITFSNDTLYSSAASGNQWYYSGTAIPGATGNYFVLPGAALTITVTVSDTFGICSATSTPWVGIDEIGENGIAYSVYPNPGDGIVNLSFQSKIADDVFVEITDVVGRKVYERKYDSFAGRSESTIDISTQGKGIYLLSLRNSKGLATRKLVLK
ncbi:MAG: VPS10 domain-containing protein [Bacteroidia bacterium]